MLRQVTRLASLWRPTFRISSQQYLANAESLLVKVVKLNSTVFPNLHQRLRFAKLMTVV